MLHSHNNLGLIDADQWRQLIVNEWRLLNVFKFVFRLRIEDDDQTTVVDELQRFQSVLRHRQHPWYTEYIRSKNEAFLYTVPFMLDSYEITFRRERYYSHPIGKMNVFAKVTNLTVNMPMLLGIDQYYFPNVKSLTLINEFAVEKNHSSHFKSSSLAMLANLLSLNHLEISSKCYWISTAILLQLIRDALYLSSLKTDMTILFLLFKTRQLQCLKTIKNLDVTGRSSKRRLNCEDMTSICQIFPNMEEFRCTINGLGILQAVIGHLSKLSRMRAFHYNTTVWEYGNDWLEDHQSELDSYPFTINCKYYDDDHDSDKNKYDSSDMDD